MSDGPEREEPQPPASPDAGTPDGPAAAGANRPRRAASLDPDAELVPWRLRAAAGWSWRLLMVAAALALVFYVISRTRLLVLPVIGAVFVAAVLAPVFKRLRSRGLPDGLAAGLTMIAFVAVVGLVVYVLVDPVAGQVDSIEHSVRTGASEITSSLDQKLGISADQLDKQVQKALDVLDRNRGEIAGGVVSGAVLLSELLGASVLTLVLAFFFLRDGEQLWEWVSRRFPAARTSTMLRAGDTAWETLGSYLRGLSVVALADSLMISAVLLVVGTPFVVPLGVLTFFAAFFPVVGAFLAGLAAALVTLVSEGPIDALVVAGAIIVVQQIDGNVLQPVVMGRAVNLHPVVTLASLTAGALVAGIPGAFLAVPLVAVLAAVSPIMLGREGREQETIEPPMPGRAGAHAGERTLGDAAPG